MKRIALVGCGGINSWSVKWLREMFDTFIHKDEIIYVKLFDNDIVEEKNILRQNQNFTINDLMLGKAEVLAKRYKFDFENTLITEENLSILNIFDDIILGVDNHKTRRLIYKFCLDNGKFLLDLRAQGNQIGIFWLDIKKSMEYYDKKYFTGEVMNRRGSCQLQSDIDNDKIQTGNRVVAYIGIMNIYLKRLRNEMPQNLEFEVVL